VRFPIELRLLIAAVVLLATRASAQDRAFVGFTVLAARDDQESRERRAQDGSPYIWSIDGGFFVTDRVAVGADFLMPGDLQSVTSGISFRIETEEKERVALATIRTRLKREEQIALDAVTGVGAVRHTTTVRSASDPLGRGPVRVQTESGTRLALLAGVEASLTVAPHLCVVPTARLYYFNRAETANTRSSVRPAVGVALRATW
jgi:hypothetical protein